MLGWRVGWELYPAYTLHIPPLYQHTINWQVTETAGEYQGHGLKSGDIGEMHEVCEGRGGAGRCVRCMRVVEVRGGV